MPDDRPRLIEVAFPLKQASLDSVHEKNVRHGHISTLHIWPARRPLAACRAALVATLLPDPGDPAKRQELLERLAGKVVQVPKTTKLPNGKVVQEMVEQTEGGILHWGRESGPDLEWFRQEIRKAYGGRAPRVLDPFAGGGAIPLEAMRLGCEATAIDINPVAWFILKCTLEYPQKLAGQKRPLPRFALQSPELIESYLKGKVEKKQLAQRLQEAQLGLWPPAGAPPDADLAWHVRAWGWWVLQRARADLERFYPTVDGKPTVAYLWARTVKCKSCRATLPLLKTRWLCKKDNKRVLLTMQPRGDATGVDFAIQENVPLSTGSAAQRREADKKLGAGTMSRSGGTCPCCGAIMTMEDIRLEGQAGRLGATMTAVVVEGAHGKEYRLPTADEVRLAAEAEGELERVFAEIPFGLPEEPTPKGGSGASRAFSVDGYGFDKWYKLFTPRQLLALGTFVKHARAAREAMCEEGYPEEWVEAVGAYLALAVDKLVDRESTQCIWISTNAEKASGSFGRFALPITWDFAEVMPWSESAGGFVGSLDHVGQCIEHIMPASGSVRPLALRRSAAHQAGEGQFELVVTDPPYYDAIPYSDLMDFYYVWLRRTLHGLEVETDNSFASPLAPKWDQDSSDGELIDDASRFGGDGARSKAAYEDGMFHAFEACNRAIVPAGRLVVVFAHKQPDAWETLASAVIRAGFAVDASWPIQTERSGRLRSQASAALASSVWLVCKKRPEDARPGWDNRVLEEMHDRLYGKRDSATGEWLVPPRLREFWDAGIRGPDFVWAATGPALEAYSKHPVVKKANDPGQVMPVSEFLGHVRRLVVDFVVGRVLSGNGGTEAVAGLDEITTYYLLHRYSFGLGDAPVGAAILYALSCGLSDSALAGQYDILVHSGGQEADEDEEEPAPDEGETEQGTASTVRLKPWQQRKGKNLGYDSASGRPAPLIDQVHRLMHLWRAGDVVRVDEYLDARGLRHNALFQQLLQALIELSPAGSEERSLLESISNHIVARGKGMQVPVQITMKIG